jgi:DnaJ-class molecular chaperone
MAHAEKCPVCYGSGRVKVGYPLATIDYGDKTCHGCGGTGWVTVQDPLPRTYLPKLTEGV